MQPHAPIRILRLPEVKHHTGYAKTAIYEKIKAGTFPRQVNLGRAVGWIESEIDAWIQARIAESRGRNELPRHNTAAPTPPITDSFTALGVQREVRM